MDVLSAVQEQVLARPYLWFSVGVSSALYLFDDVFLSSRERATCSIKTVPTALQDKISQADFDKARSYKHERMTFSMWHSFFDISVSTILLLSGWMPVLWNFSGSVLSAIGIDAASSPIGQSIAFICLSSLVDVLTELPWDLYSTFVLEEKYGFNRQTARFYVIDQLKKIGVNLTLTGVLIAVLLKVIEMAGDSFFLYAWGVMFVFSIIIFATYADFIAPIFDTFVELEDSKLRQAIYKLAESLKFPLTKIYVVENSVRSSHSNAYFYGFGSNKRIVLFDTLMAPDVRPIAQKQNQDVYAGSVQDESKEDKEDKEKEDKGCTEEQIVAVLAHELGHWNFSHVGQAFVIQQAFTFFVFYLFQTLNSNAAIYSDFGFVSERPTLIGLVLIMGYILRPLSTVFGIGMTVMTRQNEFQADRFAVQHGCGEDLIAALVRLNTDNKGFPMHDWLHSWVHRSHPGLLERIDAISAEMKKL